MSSDRLSPTLVNFRELIHGPSIKVRNSTDRILMERYMSRQYNSHFERFNQIPLDDTSAGHNLNGTYAEAEVEAGLSANQDITVGGTNADDTDITQLAGGGIGIATAGADNDQIILRAKPTIDTHSIQSSLQATDWNTALRPLFAVDVSVQDAADLTNCRIWAGFKVTEVSVTATDADQAFFRYEDSVNGGRWEANTSVSGTDTETDTGVLVAQDNLYRLLIVLDINRIPYFYINDLRVGVASSIAMTSVTTLNFYCGIEVNGGTQANQLDVRNLFVSQLYTLA